ncbi:MAG: hypothetical protein H8E15_07450 [Planctomycetes bacterium]|nr:hypothetical protein [Planctomycetota bacterium]
MNHRAFPLVGLALLLGIVVICTFWPRDVMRSATQVGGEQEWTVSDPDSLYHLRRIQLWMGGGTVTDGVDPWLNHPDGARVPWPPYYTIVARLMLGPGAPADAESRRQWIEHRAAHLPLFFAVGSGLLAALAAGMLLSRRKKTTQWGGAAAAGLLHAFCSGSIFYSSIGNADHHAFISFLNAAMLVLTVAAIQRCFGFGAINTNPVEPGAAHTEPGSAWKWAAAAGAMAGLMIGAWVGSLMYIICLQLVLAALMFRHARQPLPGLPQFGLVFHLTAAVVLIPATLASPWLDANPWMVVNLSWFHPAFLILGAAVFAPLLKNERGKHYPIYVGGTLAALGALLLLIPNSIGDGIREGFAWLSTTEQFMTNVAESRPLLGSGAEDGVLVQYLGYTIYALPLAWLVAAISAWRHRQKPVALSLLPWLIIVPILAVQALSQRRFADALAMPLAVLLAYTIVDVLTPLLRRIPNKFMHSFALLLPIAAATALQWPTISSVRKISTGPQPGPKWIARMSAPQAMYEWLRQQPDSEGVLSNWGQGHAITWAAQKPSVACNFGSYVGVESFQAPSRFFLAESRADAENLLIQRQVRWVIVPWQLPGMLQHQVAALSELPLEHYRAGQKFTSAWYRTMGARMMFDGADPFNASADAIDFLRLMHVSPNKMQQSNLGGISRRVPAGWIWQRVAGAVVEAKGEVGEVLELSLEIKYPGRGQPLFWSVTGTVDETGKVQLRVPYATETANGDGIASADLMWKIGNENGRLKISEVAVKMGTKLSIIRS